MRAVVQRVTSASVQVNGVTTGAIDAGLLLLVGIHRDDSDASAASLADRIVGCRIFNDEKGKLAHSVKERGAILAISNFTVYGDTTTGRRPSFTRSAPFAEAQRLFDLFLESCRGLGVRTEAGIFGADMQVSLVNDGPVTLVVDA